jgi:nicotinate phosphoribosyltransferase
MIERAFGLSTDLYEFTMAAAYFENGIKHRAVFELFVRSLPERRSYLIAAGLEQALDFLSRLSLTDDQIAYLREHPAFKKVSREFFDYLHQLRFTGDVWAMPEGTVAFAMEPLLRVDAPIIEAQIVETFLLSIINYETLVASKAARVVTAAAGRPVIDFGSRRAHGSEAGLLAARASYIGGCAGTSNVEAGHLFGIPTFGTLAHSFVMAFESERDAFRAFLKVFPDTATLLVDTYDTVSAVKMIAREFGPEVAAVRLDSGDLLELSLRVRQILDRAGMTRTRIFASGDLNEYRIADLVARGAAIDSFGVGTELVTSHDHPALGGVYKLVSEYPDSKLKLRMKLSKEKATYPGAKQVWRCADRSGTYTSDVIALEDEGEPPECTALGDGQVQPLLEPVMIGGKRVSSDTKEARLVRLNQARQRAAEQLKRLPNELLKLASTAHYPVRFSQRLEQERAKLEKSLQAKQ